MTPIMRLPTWLKRPSGLPRRTRRKRLQQLHIKSVTATTKTAMNIARLSDTIYSLLDGGSSRSLNRGLGTQFSNTLDNGRNYLENVTYNPIGSYLEDGRLSILVDGDDAIRTLAADQVLNSSPEA